MKTIHIHHDGQYWRGFRHAFLGIALILATLAIAGSKLSDRPDVTSVNQIDPATVGPILPVPYWYKDDDMASLRSATIYDLHRRGFRAVPASHETMCQ